MNVIIEPVVIEFFEIDTIRKLKNPGQPARCRVGFHNLNGIAAFGHDIGGCKACESGPYDNRIEYLHSLFINDADPALNAYGRIGAGAKDWPRPRPLWSATIPQDATGPHNSPPGWMFPQQGDGCKGCQMKRPHITRRRRNQCGQGCNSSYNAGEVSGGSENPAISEPMDCSHKHAQLPVKPVWPVTRILRPASVFSKGKSSCMCTFRDLSPDRVRANR